MPKSRSFARFATPRRWTEADARTVLDAARDSSLSLAAFATREGLDPQRLYFWKRRLAHDDDETASPAFVEVRAMGSEHVEIILRSGQVLRVAASIDGGVLRRLVEALERDGAC